MPSEREIKIVAGGDIKLIGLLGCWQEEDFIAGANYVIDYIKQQSK